MMSLSYLQNVPQLHCFTIWSLSFSVCRNYFLLNWVGRLSPCTGPCILQLMTMLPNSMCIWHVHCSICPWQFGTLVLSFSVLFQAIKQFLIIQDIESLEAWWVTWTPGHYGCYYQFLLLLCGYNLIGLQHGFLQKIFQLGLQSDKVLSMLRNNQGMPF